MNNKKLIRLTESDLHRIVKESVRRVLNEIGGTNNPYSDEGRYYRHLGTGEMDDSKEFSHDEIKKLVSILKENPIEEMWKPYDLGWCNVQRVEANYASGRCYLMSDPHNITAPQDMYSEGNNGTIYLEIGRMPNTSWLDESGYTYMCWK